MKMCEKLLCRLDEFLTRYRLVFGLMLAAGLSGLLALYNVNLGPLRNLNDIGGWTNRLIFIAMCAAGQLTVLTALTLLHRGRFFRLALRQGILSAGYMILLMAMNHKSFAYVNVLQPVVRAMDEGGLAAGVGMECGLSAPALTALYLVTRGPVYDMYLVKLYCVLAMCALSLLAFFAVQERGMGWREDVVLMMCLILPQGFLNAAFIGQFELIAAALLAVALGLLLKNRLTACAVCYGLALAFSGAALYALPLLLISMGKKEMKLWQLAMSFAIALLGCVPAALCGMGAGAFVSLLDAVVGLPGYASGAPNFMSLIPRAEISEIPEIFLLNRLPELDLVTNAQPFYTATHFASAMRGIGIAALAACAGLWAMMLRNDNKNAHEKAFILTLGLLLLAPNVTSAMWMLVSVLCVYLIWAEPHLRLPCCMVLFATAGAAAYPAVMETLLPQAASFTLCLAALCMALDIIPYGGKINHE